MFRSAHRVFGRDKGDGEKHQRDLFVGLNPRPYHYWKVTVADERVRLGMISLDHVTEEWSVGEEVPMTEGTSL